MEMSPQSVRSAEFKTVRKGADLDEVRVFLNDVADELERAQNQSTAMEARARAAVARLQEMSESGAVAGAGAAPAAPAPVEASADEAATITRTLLLAQRTADTTIAEARAEATQIVSAANDEAATTLDSTREMVAQLLDEARTEARRSGEAERKDVASAVEALKARRDFLESDVEQLELFITDQRNRLREAATSLIDITERVPGGLGEVRAPLLSASDDEPDPVAGDDDDDDDDDADADDADADADADDADDADQVAAAAPADVADLGDDVADGPAGSPGAPEAGDESLWIVTEIADEEASASSTADEFDPWADISGDPTTAIPVVDTAGFDDTDRNDFRFSFDDDRR